MGKTYIYKFTLYACLVVTSFCFIFLDYDIINILIGLVCLGIALWAKYKSEVKESHNELIDVVKIQEQEKYYNEIQDIWPYKSNEITAYEENKDEKAITIHSISLKYNPNNPQMPWIINHIDNTLLPTSYEAKRHENKLIGTNKESIIILSKDKMVLNNERIIILDTSNELVKEANSIIEKLLSGKKITTLKKEHFFTGKEYWDALPKYNFYLSSQGIKCDEINFPELDLEKFFKENDGDKYIWKNSIFYNLYCQNGDFECFGVFRDSYFEKFKREITRYKINNTQFANCYTDFNTKEEWDIQISNGTNIVFESLKKYVKEKTLNLTPIKILNAGEIILLQPKIHHIDSQIDEIDSNLSVVSIAKLEKIKTTIEERKNGAIFAISSIKGHICINIKGDEYISINQEINEDT